MARWQHPAHRRQRQNPSRRRGPCGIVDRGLLGHHREQTEGRRSDKTQPRPEGAPGEQPGDDSRRFGNRISQSGLQESDRKLRLLDGVARLCRRGRGPERPSRCPCRFRRRLSRYSQDYLGRQRTRAWSHRYRHSNRQTVRLQKHAGRSRFCALARGRPQTRLRLFPRCAAALRGQGLWRHNDLLGTCRCFSGRRNPVVDPIGRRRFQLRAQFARQFRSAAGGAPHRTTGRSGQPAAHQR